MIESQKISEIRTETGSGAYSQRHSCRADTAGDRGRQKNSPTDQSVDKQADRELEKARRSRQRVQQTDRMRVTEKTRME